jgi:cytochrome c-type biogenesis protein CcmF
LWPIISEAINGQKSSVPEAFFNQVVIIPGLLLLFLTGAGPIISWKKITANNFQRMFLLPLAIGLVGGALTWGFLALKGKTSPLYSVLCVSASVFVIAAISAEFYRGAKLRAKRQETSFLNGLNLLIQRNKRRYGGYIVHIGIVIVYIGIMGSKGYFLLESKSLRIGESMEVGQFQLTMKDSFEKEFANYRRTGIVFDVAKNGKQIGTMEPARHFYYKTGQGEQDTIESAIRHFGVNDFYISLGSIPPDVKTGGIVNVQAYYNPLIGVVWIGVAVMVLGGIVAIAEKSEHNKDS